MSNAKITRGELARLTLENARLRREIEAAKKKTDDMSKIFDGILDDDETMQDEEVEDNE